MYAKNPRVADQLGKPYVIAVSYWASRPQTIKGGK